MIKEKEKKEKIPRTNIASCHTQKHGGNWRQQGGRKRGRRKIRQHRNLMKRKGRKRKDKRRQNKLRKIINRR